MEESSKIGDSIESESSALLAAAREVDSDVNLVIECSTSKETRERAWRVRFDSSVAGKQLPAILRQHAYGHTPIVALYRLKAVLVSGFHHVVDVLDAPARAS